MITEALAETTRKNLERRCHDRLMHIEVSVRSQPAAKNDVVLLGRQGTVAIVHAPIRSGVDRVIGLIAGTRVARVFTEDHRSGQFITAFGMQVTELVNSCVWRI